MPFIVRNSSAIAPFLLQDAYLDLTLDISEHVDLEQVFAEDSLYMSSVSPGALYTAIQNGDLVRRNDADDTDIAIANAFDDAIWRWSPSRQQKEALVGQPLSPSSTNKYLTQGVFSIKVKVGGTPRYGNIVFLEGSNITLTDDGAGNFTFAASGGLTPYGSPVTQAPDTGNIDGTANSAARSDHKHNIPTATAVSITTANAQGASTTDFSRADHAHQGIHALSVNSGTARYGDQNFKSGNGVTVTDDGAGNFTWDTTIGPNELYVTPAALNSSLVADYTAGQVMIDGTIYSISAGNITVGTNITNGYIYVNTSGTVTSGSTLPDGAVPLALFTSNGSAITVISNKRTFLEQRNTPGADGDITSVQPDASAAAGSSERWARANHVHSTSTATPASVGSANAQGSSTTQFSKADHVHQGIHSLKANAGGTARYGDLVFLGGTNITITDDGAGNYTFASTFATSYGSPVALSPDSGNIDGVATTATRSDHKHDVPCDAPTTTLSPATTNAEGTGVSFTRNDHTHAVSTSLVGVITTIQPDDAAAAGTENSYARGDHRHAIVAAAPSASLSATTTDAEGSATSFSRSDHSHAILTGTPSTQSPDQANATGTSANLARADHIHNIPCDTPVAIGTANAEGTSTNFARADHVHAGGTFLTSNVKAGTVASGSFTGSPRKATVTFGTAFPSTSYAITITGIDARTWTYESKTTGGFTINANAASALSGEVSWIAIASGS